MIDRQIQVVRITPTSSFFAENGLFGSWPSQNDIEALISWGVDVIVNLACLSEKKVRPYTVPPDTNVDLINFPIHDRSTPDDKIGFCSLVVKICDFLIKGRKVYIHCKGGHGRSGLLVAAILAYNREISPHDAIALTSKYHSQRQVMRQRWRDMGSPQTICQKRFVISLFCPQDIDCQSYNEVKEFLLQTHLCRIVGPKGDKLMKMREKLMKSLTNLE